ncbi:hypothetical protein [Siccirubricoccus sp. G192]|uniref:hypothetical protein n=1 Tax=Siccirubricoccus sp. G192 TaxID=2849651 RepID=UPI001C2C4937|nr:hypothetical protein [Siccirubricoccus sp. G192]MBV1800637.1 hypothetical protein [Siccirubricoccus sp. G192]
MFQQRRALLTPVQEIYPTAVGDGVLLAGGIAAFRSASRAATDEVVHYDLAHDNWHYVQPLPEPLHHPCLLARSDAVLAIGGFGAGSLLLPQVGEVSDAWRMRDTVFELPLPHMTAWTPGPTLPMPRAEFSAGVIDEHVIIAGGRYRHSTLLNSRYEDHADTPSTLVLAPGGVLLGPEA